MNKFLFTDGTNGVREAHSKEELLSLINSAAEPGKCRIWKFSSHEWLDYNHFRAQHPFFEQMDPVSVIKGETGTSVRQSRSHRRLTKAFFIAALLTGALMIFNFTSAGWEPVTTMRTTAVRPANVPLMDIDSLIGEIEGVRGRPLDKSTSNNLRLRNNWPEFIFLRLNAEKEVKGNSTRFLRAEVSIDNATGFVLDRAIVQLQVWKNGNASISDTFQFNDIRFDKMPVRTLSGDFRCDSISVSFHTINAKGFNFCYSAKAKNNSGNPNDRWFCREGKMNE